MTDYVPIHDACQSSGFPERTLRRFLGDGRCEGRKVGKKWYVNVESLMRLSDRRPESPINSDVTPTPSPSSSADPRQEHVLGGRESILLERLFDVQRVGAWRKWRDLLDVLPAEERDRALDIAVSLLEGFLAYGSDKIAAYHSARRRTCSLIVQMQFCGRGGEKAIIACHELLGAMQSLIISYAKKRKP